MPDTELQNNAGVSTTAEVNTNTSGRKMSIENIVIGILIVVGLGFTTLIMQYFTATQATFQDLKDQVVEQNAKIDALTKVLELQTTQPSPQK